MADGCRGTRTGGRAATTGVIRGRWCLSVGDPQTTAPAGFAWRPLTELARLETGHTPSRREPSYWDGDIPWIGVRDATGNHGRTIRTTRERVTQAGIDNSAARLLPAGTVCVSRTASVGYVVVMGTEMATSQDFVNWVCGPEMNHRYLKYLFLAEQESLRRFAHGTTHQTIYFPEVKAFYVLLPTRRVQERVAGVLQALDDSIEINERIREEARRLAAAALQAAPVRSLKRVADVADVRRGLSYTGAGLADGGMPMVNLANASNLGWLKRDGFKHYAGAYKPRHVAPPGALFVSGVDLTWKLDILGFPLLLPEDIGPALFSHHILLVDFAPGQEWLRLPLWAYMYSSEARARIEAFAYGTTVAAIPPETITGMSFPAPASASPALRLAEDLLRRAWVAEVENQRLAELRYTMLPRLMSGGIRVKDVEDVVAEAV